MENTDNKRSLAGRPEAPWALVAGGLGALGAAFMTARSLLGSTAPTAAFEFIYVPLVAALAALPSGLWGLALGHVVARLQGRVAEPVLVFWTALAAAVAMPAAVAWRLLSSAAGS